jgi:hypothetical protein
MPRRSDALSAAATQVEAERRPQIDGVPRNSIVVVATTLVATSTISDSIIRITSS